MTDKHLKETLIKWFKIPGSAQWDERVTNKIITQIKEAIRLDTEADRLFCKEVVRGKIEGKGVEGEQFGTDKKEKE